LAAGVTLNQQYLPLVEGRIAVRPWMQSVDGDRVIFADGRVEEFDAVVLGTGFDLAFVPRRRDPFRARPRRPARRRSTPDVPPRPAGLAFLGFWDQSGPYLVPIEL
jgi:hypothetical protein